MKSFATQILFLVLAVVFLIKGGIGILAAAWKFVLPVMFLGGAYYFGRKAFASFSQLPGSKTDKGRVHAAAGPKSKVSEKGGVIEICPHCLSEVGSCPKCR